MIEQTVLISVFSSSVAAATPLLFAGIGELVAERSGVLNLSIEGMLLASAMGAFAVASVTLNFYFGLAAGIATGLLMGVTFAALTVSIRADQIVTGLAMVILGDGASRFFGSRFLGLNLETQTQVTQLPGLSEIPLLGPVLFQHHWLIYCSYLLVPLVWYFLHHTSFGLALRAAGERPSTAEVAGHDVVRIRYAAVIFGAGMAGIAGSFLSLVYLRTWQDGMTAGRGWVALAVVILAGWQPWRVLAGAYLFGFAYITAFQAQILGGAFQYVSSYLLQMFPYLLAVIVLAATSRRAARRHLGAPAALTLPYVREERL
jgi:simple sugar transport system permease protein